MSEPMWKRLLGRTFTVPNTGSAARDHLAGERTVLAWLRTSMVLTTIGITLAQLLLLPSSAFGSQAAQVASSSNSQAVSKSPALNASHLLVSLQEETDPALRAIVQLVAAQQSQLDALSASRPKILAVAGTEPSRYAYLSRPLGGTFLALSFVYLLLGAQRYYSVQVALLREPSQFPPSKRSVAFVATSVGALVIACFVAVLASR